MTSGTAPLTVPSGCHYAGNFWWARLTFLATHPKPSSISARKDGSLDRYMCGEDWVLDGVMDPKAVGARGEHDLQGGGDPKFYENFANLHYTGVDMGERGRIYSYIDRYTPEHYNCSASSAHGHQFRGKDDTKALDKGIDVPARTPCRSISYSCHGTGCYKFLAFLHDIWWKTRDVWWVEIKPCNGPFCPFCTRGCLQCSSSTFGHSVLVVRCLMAVVPLVVYCCFRARQSRRP